MENAIKIAIENGYDASWFYIKNTDMPVVQHRCVLDPLFWQALGKGLGWNDPNVWSMVGDIGHYTYMETGKLKPVYMMQWHEFIDHLDSGGEIEEFFKNLL